MRNPSKLKKVLAENELRIFRRAYRSFYDEEDLASGFGETVILNSIDIKDVLELKDHDVKLAATVELGFKRGYSVLATLGLRLADFKSTHAKTTPEQLKNLIQDNLLNVYCEKAVAVVSDEQVQTLAKGDIMDKWILFLAATHRTEDLGRHIQSNLKGCNSPYELEFRKDFKSKLVQLAVEALTKKSLC